MYALVLLALSAAAVSGQVVSDYGGVNPIVHQTPVPHVVGNGLNYGSYYNNYLPQQQQQAYVPQTYGVQQQQAYVPQTFGVQQSYVPQTYGVRQQQAYVPKTYGAYTGVSGAVPEYSRDYTIEQTGEKYGFQSGPASFQYSFIKGNTGAAAAHDFGNREVIAAPVHQNVARLSAVPNVQFKQHYNNQAFNIKK